MEQELIKDDQGLDIAYEELVDEGYTTDVTGNACKGDRIAFARARFTGSYPNGKFAGYEIVRGTIVGCSYGKKKQQHTFTIEPDSGDRFPIKARNVYRVWTLVRPRDDEERMEALNEKHLRSIAAKGA